jgi:hypothetical protein
MSQGIVVIAQNTADTNYIKCAEVLGKQLKKLMPNIHTSLITNDVDDSKYFDNVIALPYGDLDIHGKWKLVNDWQVFEASPYDYTIKLEADLYLTHSIDYYFDVCKQRDVVVCTKIRDFKQSISNERFYRKFIDDNNLPDVYNSITYFNKSDFAQKFFEIVKDVFTNWKYYRENLKCKITEEASTDWVYAIACHIMGVEKTTLSNFDSMSMVHMKQFINKLTLEDWTKELVYEITQDGLKVNTIPQMYPFHYHIKDFAYKL